MPRLLFTKRHYLIGSCDLYIRLKIYSMLEKEIGIEIIQAIRNRFSAGYRGSQLPIQIMPLVRKSNLGIGLIYLNQWHKAAMFIF